MPDHIPFGLEAMRNPVMTGEMTAVVVLGGAERLLRASGAEVTGRCEL